MKKPFLRSLTVAVTTAASVLVLSSVAQAQDTLDRILQTKTVTIGIHNGNPWGYLAKDGSVKGINASIARAVFESAGVTNLKFVVGDFGSLIPGVISKRFDMVDSGVVITPERCKLVNFGDPELISVDALLVKKGNPKNIHSYKDVIADPSIMIGGSRGSQQAKNAKLSGVPESQIKLFQNTESTISAILAGRVDGVAFTSGTANAILQRKIAADAIERVKPFSGPVDAQGKPLQSYIGAVFNKDDTKLRDFFNKKLAELKANGTVEKLMIQAGFSPDEKAPAGLTAADVCAGK